MNQNETLSSAIPVYTHDDYLTTAPYELRVSIHRGRVHAGTGSDHHVGTGEAGKNYGLSQAVRGICKKEKGHLKGDPDRFCDTL